MTDDAYARLYIRLRDDEKFAEVYADDHHFAAYCRLLMIAETSWPASAHVPLGVRRASLAKLAAVDLIELRAGNLYRITGLDAERERRSSKAAKASNARWTATSNAPSIAPSNAGPPTPNMLVREREETSIDENEQFSSIDADAQTFLEGVTGRHIRQAGDKQLAEYDRQIAAHGLAVVIAAYQRVAKAIRGTPTATQLVWSGRKLLEPFVDARDVQDVERDEPRPKAVRPVRDEAAIRAERERLIQPGATA